MKKEVFALILAASMAVSLVACGSNPSKNTVDDVVQRDIKEQDVQEERRPEPDEPTSPLQYEQPAEPKEQTAYEYDVLQNIFIGLNPETTAETLENAIKENNLYFSTQEYNSSPGKKLNYVIAYSQGAAAQKYADSGDNLEVSFDLGNDGCIMYATYTSEKAVAYSGLYYNYGTYFDFREKEPGEYSGCYINDSFSGNSGITIQYSNGRETHTNYFKYDSPEDVINAIIDYIER